MEPDAIEKLLLIQKTQQEIVNVLRCGNSSGSSTLKKDLYTNFESKIKEDHTVISENLRHLFHEKSSSNKNNDKTKDGHTESVWITPSKTDK